MSLFFRRLMRANFLRRGIIAGVAIIWAGSGVAVLAGMPKPGIRLANDAGVMTESRKAPRNWRLEPGGGVVAGMSAPTGADIPILLYHYPPPDFEQQLEHLERQGYTTISLDDVLGGLHGKRLPDKPVVLTFDDGFAAQMEAFEILKRHNMKAVFYIIAGGADSQWCIGAGRRYSDPAQPPEGCGDDYLSWEQVRQLDKSGLITIGGHTVNHRNLATLSPDDQRFEIAGGKRELERQLGHAVRHFAYPYGAYTPESTAIAKQAGYESAVTVEPGTYQPPGGDMLLRRERDALTLP